VDAGSASVRAVVARSCAEIPVVRPATASTETAKASRSAPSAAMSGMSRAASRSPVTATHAKPLLCRTSIAIVGPVTNWAAITMCWSPEPSVSSTGSPRRRAARQVGMTPTESRGLASTAPVIVPCFAGRPVPVPDRPALGRAVPADRR
jgi:hypothetical protein